MIVSHSKRKKHSLGAFKVSKNPMYLALCLSVVCAIIASAALVEDPVQGSIELINDVESLRKDNGIKTFSITKCIDQLNTLTPRLRGKYRASGGKIRSPQYHGLRQKK